MVLNNAGFAGRHGRNTKNSSCSQAVGIFAALYSISTYTYGQVVLLVRGRNCLTFRTGFTFHGCSCAKAHQSLRKAAAILIGCKSKLATPECIQPIIGAGLCQISSATSPPKSYRLGSDAVSSGLRVSGVKLSQRPPQYAAYAYPSCFVCSRSFDRWCVYPLCRAS